MLCAANGESCVPPFFREVYRIGEETVYRIGEEWCRHFREDPCRHFSKEMSHGRRERTMNS